MQPIVLVVDDEPDIRAVVGRVLGRSGADVVLAAGGGEECLAVLGDRQADLVVLVKRRPSAGASLCFVQRMGGDGLEPPTPSV